MKIKIIVFLFLIALFGLNLSFTQTNPYNSDKRFKIVFVADPRVVINKDWLHKTTEDWGATGICIRVFWGHVDTDSIPGADNWVNFDNAINSIISFNEKKLDIYLRVCLGLQKPIWVTPDNERFKQSDFQIQYNNSIYDHQSFEKGIPESERYPLNFNSPNSQKFMKNFLREVLEHINKEFTNTIKSRVKEIVPTFSTSDEEEYPFSNMCGYSSYEKEGFINYLKDKYNYNLSSLNYIWNPQKEYKDLDTWSEIVPENYKWHTYNNSEYQYPNGRIDWINFRTQRLGLFINSLSDLIGSYNYQMGVQIGSIYDNLIEKRGWCDPTIIFEKANAIHVADIYQYSENFDFGAKYLSSICKFWTYTNKWFCEPVRFSTETNWPNFNGNNAEFLSYYWTEQLKSYYDNGASEHYLVGWDIAPSELEKLKDLYKAWRETLLLYSDREIVKPDNNVAIHLGIEQVFYNHNEKSVWTKTFGLNNFITLQYESTLKNIVNFRGKDIITNYMLERNPDYMANYSLICFAPQNGFITEKAYLGLRRFFSEVSLIKNSLNESIEDESFVWYKNEYYENYKKLPITIQINNK